MSHDENITIAPAEEPALVEEPANSPTTPGESELSPEEMNATPPAEKETPTTDDSILVQVDPESSDKPTPNKESPVEPRPDEGKTLDGHDGEVVEIFDED